jgi:transposase InsO family protein
VSYDRRRKEFGGLSVSQAKRLNDLERENARLRRAVFERRACKALGQHRSSQRHQPQMRADEDALTAAIVALASRFGRHGYRRITELLQMAGWSVNAKRVRRIWRAECLKVPSRQPKRGRLGLADGPCIRLRPERSNHVRAYAFVSKTTHDSRKLRLLTVIDEHTRECRAIRAARRLTSHDVLYTLSELFLEHGLPEHIRSDNGPEFAATAIREWLTELGVTTLFIEPSSPWENGYTESFNGKLRDALVDGELFCTLKEAQILIEKWRREYNHLRSHGALGGRPPAPETIAWPGFSLEDFARSAFAQRPALALS